MAYLNTFDIQIYNFQKPSKEVIPLDYSYDYLNKLIMQRKINMKKKPEKNLATLVKTVRQKEEMNEKKALFQQQQFDMNYAKDQMQRVSRSFRMPYQISCVAF